MLLTDEKLVFKTLQGDINAFEQIVERYKSSVFSVVYRMTGQVHEAEDISQEVFLTVYTKLYQFDQSKKFAPWIHRIAVNTCISAMRKTGRVPQTAFDETYIHPDSSDNQPDFGNPQIMVERHELRKDIQIALQGLPEAYQLMLVMRYQLDLSNQEIAAALDVNKQKVEVTIHRARKALRKSLTNRWVERRKQDELSGS